jgi:hypothetical protein
MHGLGVEKYVDPVKTVYADWYGDDTYWIKLLIPLSIGKHTI